jgi:hypothetical protein
MMVHTTMGMPVHSFLECLKVCVRFKSTSLRDLSVLRFGRTAQFVSDHRTTSTTESAVIDPIGPCTGVKNETQPRTQNILEIQLDISFQSHFCRIGSLTIVIDELSDYPRPSPTESLAPGQSQSLVLRARSRVVQGSAQQRSTPAVEAEELPGQPR